MVRARATSSAACSWWPRGWRHKASPRSGSTRSVGDFGPLGTLTLVRGADAPITLPSGGRGLDTNNNGQIGLPEGQLALGARRIIRERDTKIQTVADLMQLVRLIEAGVDVDGDGIADLDPSRIYYLGYSYGANIGAVFLSVEPSVPAGVLVAPGGPSFEGLRLSPLFRVSSVGALLAARVPSLINISGLDFNENLPLRDQPPSSIRSPGRSRSKSSSITTNGWVRGATLCPTACISAELRFATSNRNR